MSMVRDYTMKKIFIGAVVATAATVVACGTLPPPPPVVVTDFGNAVACVEQNLSAGLPAIIANCAQWTIDEIIAVFQWLVANPNTPASEKALVQQRLGEALARKAAEAK